MRGRRITWLLGFLLVWFAVACNSDNGTDESDFHDAQTDDSECVIFVNDFYDICQHTLFDFERADAIQACQLGEPSEVWPCIMNCWTEAAKDCQAWVQCLADQECLPEEDPPTS